MDTSPALRLVVKPSKSSVDLIFTTDSGGPVATSGLVRYLRDGVPTAGEGLGFKDATEQHRVTFFDQTSISQTSIASDWANDLTAVYSDALVVVKWAALQPDSDDHWITVRIGHHSDAGFSPGEILVDDDALALAREVGQLADHDLVLSGPNDDSVITYFRELAISGLRGFNSPQKLVLARPSGARGSGLTILVGSNNGGKSTVIEAIHYLARAGLQASTSFSQTLRNSALDRVELSIVRDDGTLLRLASADGGGSLAQATWHPDTDARTKFDIHVTPSRRSFNPFFGNMGNATRDWNIVSQEPSRIEQRDHFPSRLREIATNPSQRIEFNRILEQIIGRPLDWTIDEFSHGQSYIRLVDKNQWHTSEGLGDGLVSLLFIAEALHDSEPGSLIALDEPELSLHPQLIRRLARVLSTYAKDRQIVIATHSPLILSWDDITNGALIARVYKHKDGVLIAQPIPKTVEQVSKLGEHDRNQPHTLGTVAAEAFFLEDGLILLEGQDDVVHLPYVLSDLGLPATDNVYGWGSGGASKMPTLAKLFLELGFTRIVAILDDDKRPETARAYHALERLGKKVLVQRIPAPDIRYKPSRDGKEAVVGLLDRETLKVRAPLRPETMRVFTDALNHVRPPSEHR